MSSTNMASSDAAIDEWPDRLPTREQYESWVELLAERAVETAIGSALDFPEDAYDLPEQRLGYETELEVDDKFNVLSRESDGEIAYDILRLSNTPPTRDTMEHVGEGMPDADVIETLAFNALLQDVFAAARDRLEDRIGDVEQFDSEAPLDWDELPTPVPGGASQFPSEVAADEDDADAEVGADGR